MPASGRGGLIMARAMCVLIALLSWSSAAQAAGVKARVTGTVVNVRTKTPVTNDTVLEKGDRVQARSADASLQLECPDGATQTLTDNFDALLIAADETDCGIRLYKGTAVATTAPKRPAPPAADGKAEPTPVAAPQKSQTEILVGPVTLGAASTHFGATVIEPGEKPVFEAYVIEGQIAVRSEYASTRLARGQMLDAEARVQPIPEERFQKLARVYARLDLTQSKPEPGQREALEKAYLQTFKAPDDAKARNTLHELQRRVAPNAAITTYQGSRAEILIHRPAPPASITIGEPAQDGKMLTPEQQKQLKQKIQQQQQQQLKQPLNQQQQQEQQ